MLFLSFPDLWSAALCGAKEVQDSNIYMSENPTPVDREIFLFMAIVCNSRFPDFLVTW